MCVRECACKCLYILTTTAFTCKMLRITFFITSNLQAFIKTCGVVIMLETSILSLHDEVRNSKLVFGEKFCRDGVFYRSNRLKSSSHFALSFPPLQDTTTIEKMAQFTNEMWVCLTPFMPHLFAFLPRVSSEDRCHSHVCPLNVKLEPAAA